MNCPLPCLRTTWLAAPMALAGLAGALPAQVAERVGTVHAVWRDPRDAQPARLEFSLVDDKGGHLPLAVDEAEVARLGGLEALRLRRARARIGSDGRATIVTLEAARDARLSALYTGAPRVMRYVTLLCRFPDFPDVNPGTLADAEGIFGESYPGAAHYWREVSDGRLSLEGSIVRGWYTMPGPRSAYLVGEVANTTALGRDCAAAADADVDFSQFQGVNFVFNTNIDCCSYGGTGSLALDGGVRGYAMTWLASSVFTGPGVAHHEIGHSLGLSHSSGSYGLVYDSRWDVMSIATWHPAGPGGLFVGSHVNAHGKRLLELIPPERDFLATPGTHDILLERSALPAENGHPLVARIPLPRFGPTQHYTVEVRGAVGYDAPLPGTGVIVHRVGGGGATPSNVIDPDGDFDPNDDGALLTPGERFVDPVNGVTISVLERVGDAFRVRLEVASHPAVTLQPAQRMYAVVAGADSVIADSAVVTLAGMPEATAWTARRSMNGPLVLGTTGGTGSGVLRWTLHSAGLAPGIYDQDLRVEAGTLAAALLRVRLVVQAPVTTVLGAYTQGLRDSLIVGASRQVFNSVAVSGPGADTTAWTASTSAPWITIGVDAGTGSGPLTYTRSTAGLAPGRFVAQVVIVAPGTALAPLAIVDTLEVLEPLSWRVAARGASRTTLGQGAVPALDSIRVELDGRYGTGASWWLTQGAGPFYLQPEFPAPSGTGWARFRRAPRDLAPGTHAGTIRLQLAMDPSQVLEVADTLVVTAAPVGLALSVPVTRDSVRGITSISDDSVFVQPTGPASSSRVWRVVPSSQRIAFPSTGLSIPDQRSGPAWIRFIRNLEARAPGWHVDTLDFLEANGSAVLARLLDSLFVAPAPVLPRVTVAAASRRAALRAGSPGPLADSMTVVASGDGAESLEWRAASTAPWITLVTAAGAGTGPLRWERSAAGLAPGWHVDTIRISAPSAGSTALVVDSLHAYPALVVASVPPRPTAMMGAPFADTLRASGGSGEAVLWTVAAGALPAGLALDAAGGRVHGIAEAGGTFDVTVRAVAGADTATLAVRYTVSEPVLDAAAVVDQVLGGAPLGDDARRYLDLQGNRNGRVDIGDVRAWRRRHAGALTAAGRATVDSVAGRAP